MKKLLFCLLVLLIAVPAFGEDNPLEKLRDQTLRYFAPMNGTIVAAEGSLITIDLGESDGVLAGMRMTVLRKGEPFLHPVTREVIGTVESEVGKFEVKEVRSKTSVGVLVSGDGRPGDLVRISAGKVLLMFCQDRKLDWYLADDYYRKLKNSGRVVMLDTALETTDEQKVIEEAKRLNADVALLLSAREADKGTALRQQLFWVAGGTKFSDSETKVDVAFTKELKFGDTFFSPRSGEALLTYTMPGGAKLVATGDFDGDGKQEIVVSNGKDLRFYLPDVDLMPLWEIKGTAVDDHIWLDTADLNGDGKDEVYVTSMKSERVNSCAYELSNGEFRKLWENKLYLRHVGRNLVAQEYSSSEGFTGPVLLVSRSGDAYKTGDRVRLPKGVNIYDFVYIEDPGKEPLVFAYDENAYLNLYDTNGIRVWRSSASTGGFLNTYKKKSSTSYTENPEGNYVKGDTWAIKDRLLLKNREVLVMQRVPVLEMAKGIGFKSSKVKNYWWNGFSMEESTVVDEIKGSILDYALAGDKLVVLSSPFLGIKFENIIKGENPLGSSLSIYSVRGR